jgi:integrase
MNRKATRGLLTHNPATNKDLRLTDVKRPRRESMTAAQVVQLIESAAEIEQESQSRYDKLGRAEVCAILALSGVRRGELCAVKRRDLNVRESLMSVEDSKTESGVRSVWLSPYLMEMSKAWLERSPYKKPSDPLFPTSNRTHRSPDNLQKDIIDKALARANETLKEAIELGNDEAQEMQKDKDGNPSVRPHGFRRTYITLALANGELPGTVLDQVGHRNERLIYRIYRQQQNRRRGRDPLLRKLYGTPAHIMNAARELAEDDAA